MRVVICAAERSGNHMLARSLAHATQAPYAVPYDLGQAGWPGRCCWIIAPHLPATRKLLAAAADQGAQIIGIERNPLDHALSMFTDLTAAQVVKAAASDQFRQARTVMFSVPADRRFSYDVLADPAHMKHADECVRAAQLLGLAIPLRVEAFAATQAAVGTVHARYGQTGRWREVLTDKQARAICAAIDEPMPE